MAEQCSHDCGSCSVGNCTDRVSSAPTKLETNAMSEIKHVVGVVSGKGGVGKTLVTCMLASEMKKRGYSVGILDADITGPSIPKSFGISARPGVEGEGIVPVQTKRGIKVISINLLLDEEDAPVAWRGPVISGVIGQFWSEVNWGELDYLFVDMPPGTSDVFLTVFNQIPVDGIVSVSAPQELVAMIVGKAVNLAAEMNVPVVGLVENMAYFVCDECQKKHYLFGEPQGAEVAKRYGIPAVATLPMDPRLTRLCDQGLVEEYDAANLLDSIIGQL